MTLEEALELAASEGRLNHLYLMPSKDEWVCGVRPRQGGLYQISISTDPVKAILAALALEGPGAFDPDIEDLL